MSNESQFGFPFPNQKRIIAEPDGESLGLTVALPQNVRDNLELQVSKHTSPV